MTYTKRHQTIAGRIRASLRLAWIKDAPPPPDTDNLTVAEMQTLVDDMDAESAMYKRVTAALEGGDAQ